MGASTKSTGAKKKVKGNKKGKSPAPTDGPKKGKLPAPNDVQKEELLCYMERHPDFANGRLKSSNKLMAERIRKMRQRLADLVNASDPLATHRDGDKWWKCWTGLRLAAKAYAIENYCSKDNRTGNGGLLDESVSSDLEQSLPMESREAGEKEHTCNSTWHDRIMAIVGWETALGTGLKDELASGSEEEDDEANSDTEMRDLTNSREDCSSKMTSETSTNACELFSSTPAKTVPKCKSSHFNDLHNYDEFTTGDHFVEMSYAVAEVMTVPPRSNPVSELCDKPTEAASSPDKAIQEIPNSCNAAISQKMDNIMKHFQEIDMRNTAATDLVSQKLDTISKHFHEIEMQNAAAADLISKKMDGVVDHLQRVSLAVEAHSAAMKDLLEMFKGNAVEIYVVQNDDPHVATDEG